MSQAALDRIKELNQAYRAITGETAYLYASDSGFTFATAERPFATAGAALVHMESVLSKAREGWTHEEIMYGKPRDPYPNARTVNRGAW